MKINNVQKPCKDILKSTIQINRLDNIKLAYKDIYLMEEYSYSGSLLQWKKNDKVFEYRLGEEVIDFLVCLVANGSFPSFFVRWEKGNLLYDEELKEHIAIADLKKTKITIEEVRGRFLEENTRYIIRS